MINRFAGGRVPPQEAPGEPEAAVIALWQETAEGYLAQFDGFQFHTALEQLFVFVKSVNAYIEKRAPWKLAKSAEVADQALLRGALATMAEGLRLSAAALRPVMPGAAERIGAALGAGDPGPWREELGWGGRLAGATVGQSLVLFPRSDPAAGRAQ
jgi:methionyl-tRNA synthetase